MIKASEARKVSLEAQEAKKKQQTLEESRRLEKLFKARMADTDSAIRAAIRHGDENVKIYYEYNALPSALRERYESQVKADEYKIEIHTNDNNDGWEIIISW